MVFPEYLKGWMLGKQKLQGFSWSQTSGNDSQLLSQYLTFFLPHTVPVSSGHPSLWPLARRQCCSHLSRAIDNLSEPFRVLALAFYFMWNVSTSWNPASFPMLPPLPIPDNHSSVLFSAKDELFHVC